MRSVIPFSRRAKARVCPGCGQPLRPEQPVTHRHCQRCWSFGQYRKAVTAFLEASRPRP